MRGTYTLNLVAIEQAPGVDKDPRQGAAEVDHFMHHEGHDTGGQDIILHPRVPGRPQALGNVQSVIILANHRELTRVA